MKIDLDQKYHVTPYAGESQEMKTFLIQCHRARRPNRSEYFVFFIEPWETLHKYKLGSLRKTLTDSTSTRAYTPTDNTRPSQINNTDTMSQVIKISISKTEPVLSCQIDKYFFWWKQKEFKWSRGFFILFACLVERYEEHNNVVVVCSWYRRLLATMYKRLFES